MDRIDALIKTDSEKKVEPPTSPKAGGSTKAWAPLPPPPPEPEVSLRGQYEAVVKGVGSMKKCNTFLSTDIPELWFLNLTP